MVLFKHLQRENAMKEKYPKLLVVSTSAWNVNLYDRADTEMIKWWDSHQVAQIYTRAELPNTPYCESFFQINENKVLKSIFKRKLKTGKRVYNTKDDEADEESKRQLEIERERYTKGRKKNSWFLRLCREAVWFFGKWKSKELDEFIDEEKPDVLFFRIFPTIHHAWIERHVIKRTGKKYVIYFEDDTLTYKICGANLWFRIHRFFLRKQLKKLAKGASDVFVISPKQKEEYDKILKRETKLLTRGIPKSEILDTPKEFHKPLNIIYSGGLLYGRHESIAVLAKKIDELNKKKDETAITLDIYSQTDGLDEFVKTISACQGVSFKGFIKPEELTVVQSKADISLFVESLKKKYARVARLSFSTKITDYLKAAKPIFAVGYSDLAPMDYLKRNDAAIIAYSEKEIEDRLPLLMNESILKEYATKARELGIKNHEESTQSKIFVDALLKAAA